MEIFPCKSNKNYCREFQMIMNSIENVLSDSSPLIQKVIFQYWELACLSHLSDKQQEQLAQILELATESEVLTFWIAEIDHIIGHKLGLLESEERISYQNQQAFLREYLMVHAEFKSEIYSTSTSKSLPKSELHNQVSSFLSPPNCLH